MLKNNKNEIKSQINKNNNTVLNINKLKYEKAKTSLIFNKDKKMIIKAEKEEQKRRNRIDIMNKEKKQNITLEKNIELLEQEEEKYLNLIRQTQLIKQELNNSSINWNKINKVSNNKSIDEQDRELYKKKINKNKIIRLQTDENYNYKHSNIYMRNIHNSIDQNSMNDYCSYNRKKNLCINENIYKKNENSKLLSNIASKSCSNRTHTNDNIMFDKKNKTRENSNNIYQRIKKPDLKQKIIDKIVNIKIRSNFYD
jgi:hypothetical protein